MTRMTGPDCVVMCNLINKYIHTYYVIQVRREAGGEGIGNLLILVLLLLLIVR